MGYEARSKQILSLLRKKGTVLAQEVSNMLHVSVVTIRKDLQRMEEEGLLNRTHGGAVIRGERMSCDPRQDAMNNIADAAAQEIVEGDCVIMNAGNTTLLIAQRLRTKKNITIITNSVAIARELVHQTSNKLIFIGGELNSDGMFTYGWDAVTQLEQYKANKLILSASGISCSAGLTTRHMEAADLLRKMIVRTEQVIAVADDTKIGFESFYHVGDLNTVNMLFTVSTDDIEAELMKIEAMGISVFRC